MTIFFDLVMFIIGTSLLFVFQYYARMAVDKEEKSHSHVPAIFVEDIKSNKDSDNDYEHKTLYVNTGYSVI